MENKMYMNYCPCCGTICVDSGNCFFCNTKLKSTDLTVIDYCCQSDEKEFEWKNELFETKIKPNPLYDAQKMQARIITEQNEEIGKHIQNTPKCPICNSTNIHKISSGNKVGSALAFGIFSIGHISKTWKCNNCGSKF